MPKPRDESLLVCFEADLRSSLFDFSRDKEPSTPTKQSSLRAARAQ